MEHYNDLPTKHKLFVDEYIRTNANPVAAYTHAGYTAKTKGAIKAGASRLLSKKEIRLAIVERAEPNEIQRAIDNKRAIEEIKKVMLREEQTVMRENEAYIETPSFSDQLSALRLYDKIAPLSKHEAMKRGLEIEVMEAQRDLLRTKVGTPEDVEDLLKTDIMGLLGGVLDDDDED